MRNDCAPRGVFVEKPTGVFDATSNGIFVEKLVGEFEDKEDC